MYVSRIQGGNAPLHLAAVEGHAEAARALLDHGADANVKNQSDDTPAHMAAYKGHAAVLKMLLEAKADPSAKNKVPCESCVCVYA